MKKLLPLILFSLTCSQAWGACGSAACGDCLTSSTCSGVANEACAWNPDASICTEAYTVRIDGGTATQCTGRANLPYDGSGTGEACAHKNPYYALGWYRTSSSSSGGQSGPFGVSDTMIIKPGTYVYGNSTADTFNCTTSYADCTTRAVPSGTSSVHTRIMGCSATGCPGHCKLDGGCPILTGVGRIEHFFKLSGKQYIDIDSIELTDNSSCGHGSHSLNCGGSCSTQCATEQSGGKIAGIIQTGASNVTYKNINIHGLYKTAVYGPVTNATIIDSNFDFNSFAGWDGDTCQSSACPSSGTIAFSGTAKGRCSIDWNGCIENPANEGTPVNLGCHSSGASGGYGDAVGMPVTGGDWSFTNCSVSHNTSDGPDLLYLNKGSQSGGTLTVKRSLIEGNVGNQVKGPNNMTLEDNTIVGNCGFFDGKAYESSGFEHCRAGGNTAVIAWRDNSSTEPVITNNTIVCNGVACLLLEGPDSESCPSNSDVNVSNNIFLMGRTHNTPTQKTTYYYNSALEIDSQCIPEVLSNDNACTGEHNAQGNCTTTNTNNFYLVTAGSGANANAYTATATDVFTGTINQGPTTFYTGTDYADQLFIKTASIARNIANTGIAGTDDKNFNNFYP